MDGTDYANEMPMTRGCVSKIDFPLFTQPNPTADIKLKTNTFLSLERDGRKICK